MMEGRGRVESEPGTAHLTGIESDHSGGLAPKPRSNFGQMAPSMGLEPGLGA